MENRMGYKKKKYTIQNAHKKYVTSKGEQGYWVGTYIYYIYYIYIQISNIFAKLTGFLTSIHP